MAAAAPLGLLFPASWPCLPLPPSLLPVSPPQVWSVWHFGVVAVSVQLASVAVKAYNQCKISGAQLFTEKNPTLPDLHQTRVLFSLIEFL